MSEELALSPSHERSRKIPPFFVLKSLEMSLNGHTSHFGADSLLFYLKCTVIRTRGIRFLSTGLPASQVPTILSSHIITKFDTTSLNKHHKLSATHTRTHARRLLESVTWTVLDVQASADSFWRTGLHYSSWTCSSRSRGYKARGRKKKKKRKKERNANNSLHHPKHLEQNTLVNFMLFIMGIFLHSVSYNKMH